MPLPCSDRIERLNMVNLPPTFAEIPRVKLLFDHPSPLEKLERLSAVLDCGSTFWIKREDCNSGLAYGGNKVRKLEYVIHDALANGADTLVTTGGLQSNHMRQTAAAAARLGFKTVLAPLNAFPSEDEEYRYSGNLQLDHIMDAELLPTDITQHDAMEHVRQNGGTPYWIPAGASAHPLGGLGYARWFFELLEQEKALGINFDTIVVPTASGSTLAGMVAGFKLAKKAGLESISNRRFIGIQAMTQSKEEITKLLSGIVHTTGSKIGLEEDNYGANDFEVDSSFNAGRYGKLDARTGEAIKELAKLEGILADPVYTGKALTGLLHKARAGEFAGSKHVLFCHTGGQAALSAYPSLK